MADRGKIAGKTDSRWVGLILPIICPTFKRFVFPACSRLEGFSAVKGAVPKINATLNTLRSRDALRTNIRSYYASVNHQILLRQLTRHYYDDPILLRHSWWLFPQRQSECYPTYDACAQ